MNHEPSRYSRSSRLALLAARPSRSVRMYEMHSSSVSLQAAVLPRRVAVAAVRRISRVRPLHLHLPLLPADGRRGEEAPRALVPVLRAAAVVPGVERRIGDLPPTTRATSRWPAPPAPMDVDVFGYLTSLRCEGRGFLPGSGSGGSVGFGVALGGAPPASCSIFEIARDVFLPDGAVAVEVGDEVHRRPWNERGERNAIERQRGGDAFVVDHQIGNRRREAVAVVEAQVRLSEEARRQLARPAGARRGARAPPRARGARASPHVWTAVAASASVPHDDH